MPLRSDGFIPPCIATRAHKVPIGPDWIHEVKHDGYRLQVRREGDAVRLFTRRGFDWTDRYPAIGAARDGAGPPENERASICRWASNTGMEDAVRPLATGMGIRLWSPNFWVVAMLGCSLVATPPSISWLAYPRWNK
jgi:ATP dependent DNA ligase-like protein